MAVRQELHSWALEQENNGVPVEDIVNALPGSSVDPHTAKWARESIDAGHSPEMIFEAFKKAEVIKPFSFTDKAAGAFNFLKDTINKTVAPNPIEGGGLPAIPGDPANPTPQPTEMAGMMPPAAPVAAPYPKQLIESARLANNGPSVLPGENIEGDLAPWGPEEKSVAGERPIEKIGAQLGQTVSSVAHDLLGMVNTASLSQPDIMDRLHASRTPEERAKWQQALGRWHKENTPEAIKNQLVKNVDDYYNSLGALDPKNQPKGIAEEMAYGLLGFIGPMLITYPLSGGAATGRIAEGVLEHIGKKFGPKVLNALESKIASGALGVAETAIGKTTAGDMLQGAGRFLGRTALRAGGGAAGGSQYALATDKPVLETAEGFAMAAPVYGAIGELIGKLFRPNVPLSHLWRDLDPADAAQLQGIVGALKKAGWSDKAIQDRLF